MGQKKRMDLPADPPPADDLSSVIDVGCFQESPAAIRRDEVVQIVQRLGPMIVEECSE